MDQPGKKNMISEKSLPEIPWPGNLYNNPQCHTLLKTFEISKTIALVMNLLSTATRILCMIRVKTSV